MHFQMKLHAHPFYEIYYFRQGKCTYLIGDQIYVLSPGDLILMHGLTLHSPSVDPEVEYKRTIIHFEPAYIANMIQPPFSLNVLKPFQELRNHRFQLQGEERSQMEASLLTLEQLFTQQDAISYHRFHALLLDLLFMIYGYCQKPLGDKPEFPSSKEHHVQRIITFVEENFQEDIHLDEIEGSIHLSKYYLVKIFKEVTGITIFTYLYQRRINQAKILFLLEKQKSVTDICYEIGFKHPAHFSRIFKQLVGCTPEKYRKSIL
ncbi:AraC family transcriptional regulator [Paenibacillus psychroresistens]|uniref:AraC family transcriptional regulator n=2 Tax=Paenibacillus psychroresistens TaxID=1778678 RepID=A0A6B8RVS1_9BACL|nr:AraC family transcriptional regulator [Paenibacillus psychroresistens]